MTALSDERIFSDSLLGPPSGSPIMVKNQGMSFLSRLIASTNGALPVAANDHVRFVNVLFKVGDNITLDTTSPYNTLLNTASLGRITLLPGTYILSASVLEIGTLIDNGVIEASLMNSDTGAFLNPTGVFGAGTDRYLLHDKAVLSVSAPTRIELNFVFASGLNSYSKALIEVEQVE